MNNETKGMLLGLLGICGFGFTLPATRMVVPYLDPIFIGLGRAVIAALVAAMLLLWSRQSIPNKNQFYQLIIVALGVVVGFPLLTSWAMQYTYASHGAVLAGVLPLATAVIGVLIGNEKPSIGFWIVGLSGAILVASYALLQGAGELQLADLALLAAILSAAIGYSVGAKLSKNMGGWQVICWALVLAFPFIIIPTISHAPESLSVFPAKVYFSFLYLALVSQLLAFFAWYKGLALGGIARVSQIQLLQPFITILASVLFLNEIIDNQTMIFALLVVSSVWLGKKMPINQKS